MPLAILYTNCLRLGQYPDSFKIGTTKHLFKGKGDKTNPRSYRPITKTQRFLSKILEKIIQFRMCKVLEMKKTLIALAMVPIPAVKMPRIQ